MFILTNSEELVKDEFELFSKFKSSRSASRRPWQDKTPAAPGPCPDSSFSILLWGGIVKDFFQKSLTQAAGRGSQFAKPCHIGQSRISSTGRCGPPATAVLFGNRPAPSAGRHLTGQKGLQDGPYAKPRSGRSPPLRRGGGPLAVEGFFPYEPRVTRGDVVSLSLSRRNVASDSSSTNDLRRTTSPSAMSPACGLRTAACEKRGCHRRQPLFFIP